MRKTPMLLASAAAAAAFGPAASAQTPYNYGYGYGEPTATLYEQPNFQGRSIVVRGQDSNLSGSGFNDRARSARLEGAWRICADADYRGHCETLSGNIAYLPRGLSGTASSLQSASNGGYPGYPGGGYPQSGTAVLYEYPNFQGRSVVISNAEGNLANIGFNDRARSARFSGTWRICEDAGFRGHCENISGNVANLSGRVNGLSSLQQTGGYGGGYPGYPGGGQGVQGRSVVFYPGEASGGYGAPYGSYAGTRQAADDFCRQMGNHDAVWYGTSGGRLSDVLCRR